MPVLKKTEYTNAAIKELIKRKAAIEAELEIIKYLITLLGKKPT